MIDGRSTSCGLACVLLRSEQDTNWNEASETPEKAFSQKKCRPVFLVGLPWLGKSIPKSKYGNGIMKRAAFDRLPNRPAQHCFDDSFF